MEARFQWTRESLKTPAGREAWVDTMAAAITDATKWEPVFRGHDSGDFFSPSYIRMWIEVCRRLVPVKFWFPSRAWQQPVANGAFRIMGPADATLTALRELAALPNVVIRPSALMFGDAAPVIEGLAAGSTAASQGQVIAGYQCPAKAKYDGHCGPCRQCWQSPAVPVVYPQH